MGCLRGQLSITAKLTKLTRISPSEIGEQSPRGVKNLLANSAQPARDWRDFDKFKGIPTSPTIFLYSETTFLLREAESSPRIAYPVNHFHVGVSPDLQAAHCHKK